MTVCQSSRATGECESFRLSHLSLSDSLNNNRDAYLFFNITLLGYSEREWLKEVNI